MDEFTPSLRRRILDFLNLADYQPLRRHDLSSALNVPGPLLRGALRELEREGLVERLRKNRWAIRRGAPILTGRLRVHAEGYGFVRPDQPGRPDIYLPAESLGPALDGDRVAVALRSGGRPETLRPEARGHVVRVLESRHARLVGRLCRTTYYWYVIPDHPRIRDNVRVRNVAEGAQSAGEGHLVVVELDPREQARQALSGVVVEDLGPADRPGADMLAVMYTHDLQAGFPTEALRQAARHAGIPSPALFRHRMDLRSQVVFTIDPEDARDYDDAVSLNPESRGRWQLGVHIADVSYYVPPDSPVDREARRRGTSVYLADRVIPMLPPHLTTEVCSLQPGTPRLTHSVLITLNEDAEVLETVTGPSVIQSAARLNYRQVQAFFEGEEDGRIPSVVQNTLRHMRELARRMRSRRMKEGSLDLTVPEIRCRLDSEGRVVAVEKRETNEAYQLIEEFMLAANRVVAVRTARAGMPSLYRVHDEPDAEQWERMRVELRALGLAGLPPRSDSLSELVRRVAASPMSYAAQLTILRNLKRAVYADAPRLHFGLAFGCYTHFTSPIRRYPDLMVHRVLKALETHAPPPYTAETTARLAEHCSEMERRADEAEQESVERKRLEYYRELLARGDMGPFPGVVVSLQARGLTIELSETLQRGHLPLSALPSDHYVFDRDRMKLTGRRHRQTWRVGQSVNVLLARVDTRRRTLALALAEPMSPRIRRLPALKRRQRIR